MSFGYTPFKLNCDYYPWMLYKKDINLCSKPKSVDKLLIKLRETMIVCKENLYHAKKLQK